MNIEKAHQLIKQALKVRRSKEEITQTFLNAGIINNNGFLKEPYKDLRV